MDLLTVALAIKYWSYSLGVVLFVTTYPVPLYIVGIDIALSGAFWRLAVLNRCSTIACHITLQAGWPATLVLPNDKSGSLDKSNCFQVYIGELLQRFAALRVKFVSGYINVRDAGDRLVAFLSNWYAQ